MSLALLKPKFSMKLAFILLERKIRVGFMEKSDLSKVLKVKQRGMAFQTHGLSITLRLSGTLKRSQEREMCKPQMRLGMAKRCPHHSESTGRGP